MTPTEERNKNLVTLLERLAQEDELFEYNVPPIVRSTYSDDDILTHLRKTYEQREFFIEEPEYVGRYIRAGDRVKSRQDIKNVDYRLDPGTRGVVIEMSAQQPKIRVQFPEVTWWLKPEELVVYGKKKRWGQVTYQNNMPGDSFNFDLNYLVEYTGKRKEKIYLFVPKGTEGIVSVVRRNHQWPIQVFWERVPGVVGYENDDNGYESQRQLYFVYSYVSIIRRNRINLPQLMEECSRGEPKDV